MEGSRIIDSCERIEVAFVRSLGDLRTAVEIGDAFAQRLPGQFAAPVPLDGPQDFEGSGLGNGGLQILEIDRFGHVFVASGGQGFGS